MNVLTVWDKINDLVGTTLFHPQYFVLKAEKSSVNITLSKLKSKVLDIKNVLDIGCGRQLLRKGIEDLGYTYISLDHPKIYQRQRGKIKPDILADITKLPIENSTYKNVMLLMVLAHLPNPTAGINEIYRILESGGYLFISSVENYPAHDLPDDYFRYRVSGINALCQQAGFKIIEKYSWGNVWQINAINFNMYLMQLLKYLWDKTRNILLVGFLLTLFYPLMLISNLLAIILGPLDIVKSSKLINFVIAQK